MEKKTIILNSLYLHVVIDDKNVGDGVAVDVLAVVVAAFGQDQAVALLLANIDVTYRPWGNVSESLRSYVGE